MNNYKSTLVLDIGTGRTKAGLADSENPECIIPTGNYDNSKEPEPDGDFSYHPIHHGVISNYDHIEELIGYICERQLLLKSEEHPVLITQPPKNPQRDKEMLAEICFEKFQVPALYEEIHSVLTFYSSGKPAGLIVESGHGVTSVVPILSGFAIAEAILRIDVGGSDVEQYLTKLLDERKSLCINTEESRLLKENFCVVPEYDDCAGTTEKDYTLPDGRTITLGAERYNATDPLFQPSLVEQYDIPGIQDMLFQSIFKCGVDLRKEFANNIILSGGNTLLNGLEVRLKNELQSKVPASMNVNIIANPDREIFVWRGGAILGSLSTFTKNICVSAQEYQEFGRDIIKKKFSSGL